MKIYGWAGLILLIVSEYCLIHQIEPFHTWFYCFAWWSYILLADNLLLKLRGRSLLTDRRKELWSMLPLSVFIWLLFESYNFILNNWSYSIAPMQLWQRWLGYSLSFATVLPGIFITSDLVETFWDRKNRPAASECESLPSKQLPRPSLLFAAVGLALMIAPLIWPKFFFAAVWLGPIFFLDPLLEKVRIRSLSLSIFEGNRNRIWCLMLGGLLCGLMWEFWNFWAGSKWNYTVPFFGKWKVFEMPILGFLGFPPFAIECWILYHLLRSIPQRFDFRAFRIAWWICLGILSIIIMRGIDQHTVVRFA
ncbi:MAG: hypothetical protein JXA73_24680 [Acidobacteria bacterium]|nr:hypothetical protein [Acidobacteriota bacterium]